MKIFDTNNFPKGILPKAVCGYDFRTIDEYFDLNGIDESVCEQELTNLLNAIYITENWQWGGVKERSMKGHIWYIEESIKTHTADLLINKIKSVFGNDIYQCVFDNEIETENDVIRIDCGKVNPFVDEICVGGNILLNTPKSQMLYDILELWLYYITTITKVGNVYQIYIEPAYTKCISETIKNNGGFVYHITSKENAEKILKNGIRPKTGKTKNENSKTGYRYFPKRNFFIGCCKTKKETKENIKNALAYIGKHNDYVIIEIDTTKHDIDFWVDRALPEIKNAVYSHTFIPNSFITRVLYNIEEI